MSLLLFLTSNASVVLSCWRIVLGLQPLPRIPLPRLGADALLTSSLGSERSLYFQVEQNGSRGFPAGNYYYVQVSYRSIPRQRLRTCCKDTRLVRYGYRLINFPFAFHILCRRTWETHVPFLRLKLKHFSVNVKVNISIKSDIPSDWGSVTTGCW